MALHKGGNDFPAFKDLFYLLVDQCQMPSCGLRMVRGQERDQVQNREGADPQACVHLCSNGRGKQGAPHSTWSHPA